jgi:hypothetical protein
MCPLGHTRLRRDVHVPEGVQSQKVIPIFDLADTPKWTTRSMSFMCVPFNSPTGMANGGSGEQTPATRVVGCIFKVNASRNEVGRETVFTETFRHVAG